MLLRFLQLIMVVVGPIAFLAVDNSIYPISFNLRKTIGLTFSGLLLMTYLSRNLCQVAVVYEIRSITKTIFAALGLVVFALVFSTSRTQLLFGFIASSFTLLLIIRANFGISDKLYTAQFSSFQASIAFLLVNLISELVPHIRLFGESQTKILNYLLNRYWESELLISSDGFILNAWLYIVFIFLFRTVCFPSTSWQKFILAGFTFAIPFGIVLLPIHSSMTTLAIAQLVGLYWMMYLIVYGLLNVFLSCKSGPFSDRSYVQWNLWKTGYAAVCMLVGLVLLNFDTYLAQPKREILVHNHGGLDWEVATFEKPFGGMFGQLPKYLIANGYDFKVLDKQQISDTDLGSPPVLMLINSGRIWAQSEIESVHNFVRSGGTLLVLGDHTDVFGLMKSFNLLLDVIGIQFLFDSAYHARKSWDHCVVSGSGVLESRWEQHDSGISIGSSLKLHGFARPLVTGRFGHSDSGVRENHVGSYLGNYSLDSNELIGNLPLVAQVSFGKGRVVVYGDTSTFQGGIAKQFKASILPLFEFICRKPGLSERNWLRVVATMVLIAMFFLQIFEFRLSMISLLSLGVAMFFGQFLVAHQAKSIQIDRSDVLIAQCQANNIGHYELRMNSLGPLYSCLFRSGLRIHELSEWNTEMLNRSRAVFFIGPTKKFSKKQVREILEFERNGGVVVLAAGFQDSIPSTPLINEHQLAIEDRPMGTVKFSNKIDKENQRYPRIFDGWPIISTSVQELALRDDVDVLLQLGKEIPICFCKKGKGGLLLIADTRYFSNQNIEEVSGFKWEGNIQFLRQVFEKYLHTRPNEVKPLFSSPKKPD